MQPKRQATNDTLQSFYNPGQLSLFSTLSNIAAWITLALAVVYPLFQIFNLDNQLQFYDLPINGPWWISANLTSPIVMARLISIAYTAITLASNFILFKSISIGLNVLLEVGFTVASNNEEVEETENE